MTGIGRMVAAAAAVVGLLGTAGAAGAHHPELTSYEELRALAADWERRGAEVTVPARSRP